MKQVVQSYKNGELKVAEVPAPALLPGSLLIRNQFSAISSGTEGLMMELASKNLLGKALARPDLVKRVIEKVKLEGIKEAYFQSRARLEQPVPLGYSAAGTIEEAGAEVKGFHKGERIACAGSGFASHAEMISVPAPLCVPVPTEVKMEHAAFACLAAISIHSLRLASLKPGEPVFILGLGLLGQIACQVAHAWEMRVLAADINPMRVKLALAHGADDGGSVGQDDIASLVKGFTGGKGARAVIIFASTPSQQPLELAAEVCGDGGKIVAPGMIGLNIPRRVFYEKELSLVVPRFAGSLNSHTTATVEHNLSISDSVAYNMKEFLKLAAENKVNMESLITHHFQIGETEKAYALLKGKERGKSLGVLLSYVSRGQDASGDRESASGRLEDKIILRATQEKASKPGVGFIGAGLFARGTLLPVICKTRGISLTGIATATSTSSAHTAEKWGFSYATTDYKKLLKDSSIQCIFIATRHNLHAGIVEEALLEHKKVFVEKPLALNMDELSRVVAAHKKSNGFLMVGFNRRFAPLSLKARDLLGLSEQPLTINYRINAGFVPADSWTQDPAQGGGRIIGEVCHFIDHIQFFTRSLPELIYAQAVSSGSNPPEADSQSDDLVINMKMKNGSIAAILYTASGDRAFPRERIEIFGRGSVLVIDDFKNLTFTREGKATNIHRFSVDRGHKNEIEAFFKAAGEGSAAPVKMEEYIYTTLATFKIVESLRKKAPQEVDANGL